MEKKLISRIKAQPHIVQDRILVNFKDLRTGKVEETHPCAEFFLIEATTLFRTANNLCFNVHLSNTPIFIYTAYDSVEEKTKKLHPLPKKTPTW